MKAHEALSGEFEVKDGQAIIKSGEEMEEDRKIGVTQNLDEGVAVGSSPKFFNISLPAGTYNNFTITLNTSKGDSYYECEGPRG